jgi:hypothetical protein
MWKKTNLFYLGCLWEVVRLFFLFSLVTLLSNPGGRVLYTLYFLWLEAPLLVIPLLFFLSAFQPERIPTFRPILLFGKALELIPLGILLVVFYILPTGGVDKSLRGGIAVPLTIGWIDFLFLLFLLFYPHQQEP